jgi:hypothetical protein
MSTHQTSCTVCEEPCYCYQDEHALGVGGNGNGGCGNEPYIDFCSLECAEELQRRLVKGIANYKRVIGEQE